MKNKDKGSRAAVRLWVRSIHKRNIREAGRATDQKMQVKDKGHQTTRDSVNRSKADTERN
jgi:uncharacterized protein YqeY